MPANLTPQDLQFLAMMPKPGQTAGGINAFNQAAFANPVPANQPYGIVPTAPMPAPMTALPFQQAQQQSGQQQGQQQIGQQQQLPQQPAQSVQQHLLALLKQQKPQAGGPHGVRGAQQGGPGVGSTAAKEALSDFERANVAVSPSFRSAISLAGAVTGPFGLAAELGKAALTAAFHPTGLLGEALTSGFNVPGPQLSQYAMDQVTKSFYGTLNPTASNINQALATARSTLDVERALAGPGGYGQVNTTVGGPTPIGGWGMNAAGEFTGNFTSGLGNRMIGAANFGGRGSTGGGGLGGAGGGGDGSGGLGGGVGHGSGSNRSM